MRGKGSWVKNGLIINGRLPDLNYVIKKTASHWSNYSKEKKEWTELVAWECKRMKQIDTTRNVFLFKWFLKNARIDPDNAVFARKYVLDGMILSRILPDDSQKYVAGFMDIVDVDRLNPRVEVYLLPKSTWESFKRST